MENNVIDFYGYKATGIKMSPEQYDTQLTQLRNNPNKPLVEKVLNQIVLNTRAKRG